MKVSDWAVKRACEKHSLSKVEIDCKQALWLDVAHAGDICSYSYCQGFVGRQASSINYTGGRRGGGGRRGVMVVVGGGGAGAGGRAAWHLHPSVTVVSFSL